MAGHCEKSPAAREDRLRRAVLIKKRGRRRRDRRRRERKREKGTIVCQAWNVWNNGTPLPSRVRASPLVKTASARSRRAWREMKSLCRTRGGCAPMRCLHHAVFFFIYVVKTLTNSCFFINKTYFNKTCPCYDSCRRACIPLE